MRQIVMLIFWLCGCSLSTSTPAPASSPSPLPEQSSTTTWQTIAPGLERITYLPTPDNEITKLEVLRINPANYFFRAHYRPDAPLTIREWAAELPGAVAFINANFFDTGNQVIGLLVSDSIVHGSTLVNRGGTFLVQNGQPRLRSNIVEPYTGEGLEQAVQAFPMLMLNGTQAYTDTSPDRFTRRTVVAQDANGFIVLMATPLIGLPLLDLSTYLPTTDMNLINALNLDGGGSTLMYLNTTGTPEYIVTSLDPVPAVLAVYPR